MTELNIPKVELQEALGLALATWGQMCDASFQALAERFGAEEAVAIPPAATQNAPPMAT